MKADDLLPFGNDEQGDVPLRRPNRSWPADFQANHPLTPDPDDLRDPNSVGLGRYLCAARLIRDLSYDEAACRSGVDRVMIIALERGLLRPARIQSRWLVQLARLYEENVDDLHLLLGLTPTPPAPPAPEPVTVRHTRTAGWGFNARHAATTYLGTGYISGPEQVRMARPTREPDRQFMDK